MIITDDRIVALVNLYKVENKEFDNMETESAPSGEWDEYNIPYLQQQERVWALQEALEILGVDYE